MTKTWKRRLGWTSGSVLILLLLSGGSVYWLLESSLPELSGERTLHGLQAEVTVSRDALGAAVIQARNRLDASRALGFVHAQERFFQMDLSRRRAAGELSALVGEAALDVRSARGTRTRDPSVTRRARPLYRGPWRLAVHHLARPGRTPEMDPHPPRIPHRWNGSLIRRSSSAS